MDIKIKAMELGQYEKYLAFISEGYEKVNEKKKRAAEFALETQKWVVQEVYGIDPYTMHPGTMRYVAEKTVELTEKSEIEDEKNSEKSGIGE